MFTQQQIIFLIAFKFGRDMIFQRNKGKSEMGLEPFMLVKQLNLVDRLY